MTEKSLKFGNKIIVFALILLTSLFSLALYFTLDRTPASATTETGLAVSGNLYNTDGTLNANNVGVFLNKLQYSSITTSTTLTSPKIAGRVGLASDGSRSFTFQMGYYADKSGNLNTSIPITWQATYLRNGYLTVWMANNYTVDYFNARATTSSGWGNGTDYYSTNGNRDGANYSQSTAHDITLNIYSAMSQKLSNFSNIIKSPQEAGATWQRTQANGSHNTNDKSVLNGMESNPTGGGYMDRSDCNPFDYPWISVYNDKFWLPSSYEIYSTSVSSSSSTNGLWQVNNSNLRNPASSTPYHPNSSNTSTNSFLRSGNSFTSSTPTQIATAGSNMYIGTSSLAGVRPACHIDLNALGDMVAIITVRSSNESQGIVSGGGEYVVGTSSTTVMTATPNTGYIFLYWQDSSSVQYYNNPLIVPVTGDETYTAYFRQSYVTITTSNDSAEIDSSIVDTTGTTTSLNLTFNTGNYISGITVNNGVEYPVNAINGTLAVNDNSCTAIDFRTNPAGSMLYLAVYGARAEVTITLHFVNIEQSYTPASGGANIEGVALQVSGGEGSNLAAVGEARITGYTTTNNLTTVHVSAVASSGYYFVGWETSDGTDLSTYGSTADIPYSLVEGKILTAVFAPNPSNSQTNGSTDNTSGEIV